MRNPVVGVRPSCMPTEPPSLFKRLKFVLICLLRRWNLLPLADRLRFFLSELKSLPANRRFMRQHPSFVPPPKKLAYDAYNHANWPAYWESGRVHARFFATAILSEAKPGPLDVLEWGCGPCRLLRHMGEFLGQRAGRLAGADYNPETIAWCRAQVPGPAFVHNGLMPPLPFEAESFDAVYNFSVFTHLSAEVQLAWAAELHRILRPGGVLVCTTHGSNYRYMLSTPAEKEAYARGDCIEQARYTEGAKWFFAIHPEAFVRDRLLADFAGVKRLPSQPADALLQDVWIARKAQ